VDLLGEHLAQGPPEDGEVLGEQEHLAAVDRAPPGDDTVGVGPLVDATGEGTVSGEHVELVERARIEQVVDPLAGKHLALVLLALHRPLGPRLEGLFLALGELVDPLSHRLVHTEREVSGGAPPWSKREVMGRRAAPAGTACGQRPARHRPHESSLVGHDAAGRKADR
jgi:hypothetical protein